MEWTPCSEVITWALRDENELEEEFSMQRESNTGESNQKKCISGSNQTFCLLITNTCSLVDGAKHLFNFLDYLRFNSKFTEAGTQSFFPLSPLLNFTSLFLLPCPHSEVLKKWCSFLKIETPFHELGSNTVL